MEKPALKLKIVNEVMYLCCKNSILEKNRNSLGLTLLPNKGFSTYSIEV